MLKSFANTPLAEGVRQDFVNAQSRADPVYALHGDSAPRPLDGERPEDYRCRLLEPLKPHSKTWRGVEKLPRDEPTLQIAENTIYADAIYAAEHPVLPPGVMIEKKTTDRTGRKIIKFYGDPAAWLDQFKYPVQRVVSWPGGRPR